MGIRDCVQIHIAEEPGKAVKILVLAPAAGCPLERLDRKLVPALSQILCQFKLRRGKAVLAVSHELPVQPDSQSALRSLEGDEQPLFPHSLWYGKHFHIASHRIEMLRDLSRPDILMPFPWILGIDIPRDPVSLHLDVRGHADVIPV